MSDKLNTLIIRSLNDNRVAFFEQMSYGIPAFNFDDSTAFDSSSFDYEVWLNNYDTTTFGSDDLLTEVQTLAIEPDSGLINSTT